MRPSTVVFVVILLACLLPATTLAGAKPTVTFAPIPSPLLALQLAQLTASDGAAHDNFGYSIAISGDTALVGAPFHTVGVAVHQGAAYVFTRSNGSWIQQAQLTANDGAANDTFGVSVALSGNTALVAASNRDVGVHTDQGCAYVFVRSGTTWTQQARLTASDGAAYDRFGCRVALSGNTAIAGVYTDDIGAHADQGSACVFTRSGTSWSQQAKLTAADGAAGDWFGYWVAVSGNTAVVGAPYDDIGGRANQGSACVFTRSGSKWKQKTKLTAGKGEANDYFGSAVSVSARSVLVGAPYGAVGGHAHQGSAYVFVGSSSHWKQQARLTAADGAADDWFGSSVSISGDSALVGAPHDAIGGHTNQGSACVFMRSGSSWVQQATYTAPDGASGDCFGQWGAAISGENVLLGAMYDDVSGKVDQGSAYTCSTVTIDTGTPAPHVTKSVSVKRGKKLALPFMIADPAPSCGRATVTITIRLKTKVVKTIKLKRVLTNKARSYVFKVTLKKGSYTWTVQATDIAGNIGTQGATKKLIVK